MDEHPPEKPAEPKRSGKKGERPQTRKKGPRKVTPTYLENAALYYLERFATSSANLRRVLMGKVTRSAYVHGTDPDEGAAMVDALIARYQGAGLLDDAAYARMRTTSLHRAGQSLRSIRGKLMQKGVAAGLIDDALAALEADEDTPDLDRAAAIRLARKRRLGPWRAPDKREAKGEKWREKDMAALARAGFSYDIARAVIDAEDPDELDEDVF